MVWLSLLSIFTNSYYVTHIYVFIYYKYIKLLIYKIELHLKKHFLRMNNGAGVGWILVADWLFLFYDSYLLNLLYNINKYADHSISKSLYKKTKAKQTKTYPQLPLIGCSCFDYTCVYSSTLKDYSHTFLLFNWLFRALKCNSQRFAKYEPRSP